MGHDARIPVLPLIKMLMYYFGYEINIDISPIVNPTIVRANIDTDDVRNIKSLSI
jgi:hypothetical protein